MLLEHAGKAILASYGVTIPRGTLVDDPARPTGVALPAVVKAQVPVGKRGKSGGIRVVATEQELNEAVGGLIGSTLQDYRVGSVLVEERLSIARELYLSIVMDRSLSRPVLLASAFGGIDVEEADAGSLLGQPLDLCVGIRRYHVRAAARAMKLDPAQIEALAATCAGMWRAFTELEAMLVEVNPLIQTSDGRLIAADVKFDLDGRGTGARRVGDGAPTGTRFEQAAAEFNAVGVEMRGDIAIVASGAGVLMATADSVASRGGEIAGVLDLGGFPRPEETEAAVFRSTTILDPRVVFFNFFTQVMRCDQYAKAIVAAFGYAGAPKIVARMKGHYGDEGREILGRAGFAALEDYDAACDVAVRAARAS
ncbi:MAG TPA: ATP-grasp domain-containing protein [Candidatus Dormibacteraeota bacterium]|nr:ATP-grasp domain-containing protein [Candidatus Dormibacteraeota bacterium]